MTRLVSYLAAFALTASLTGCFVATRPGRTTVVERCAPNEHWEGDHCRHNGNAYGHRDHDDDDHDHGHHGHH